MSRGVMEGDASEPPRWVPCGPHGPAQIGHVGRWLDTSDDFVGDWPRGDESCLLLFPRRWPAAFSEPPLRALINKQLRGSRCRVVGSDSEEDALASKALALRPLHSFGNAMALSEMLGWRVVKGFVVLERTDVAGGASSFVAIRHWWNSRDNGSWLDLTPPSTPLVPGSEARVLLVESVLGEKPARALTATRRDFSIASAHCIVRAGALALACHLVAGGELPTSLVGAGSTAAMGGEAGGAAGGDSCRRASSWSSYETNQKWDRLADDADDEDERQSVAAHAEAELKAAVEAAKARCHDAEDEREHTSARAESASRLTHSDLGLTAITADDLARFGVAAEEEHDRVRNHECNLQLARARLEAANHDTTGRGMRHDPGRWDRVCDAAMVDAAEEDRPATRVQDMLRQMMGGERDAEPGAESEVTWR